MVKFQSILIMQNLNNLTIIIPTYNRQKFVLRNIMYWNNKEPQIIVLDGSVTSINDDLISSFGKNIKYFHLPLSFSERLNFVSNIITTEYSVLLGDDDFFIPSGLSACIDVLSNNQALNCCLGRALSYNFKEGNVVYDICYPEMSNYRIDADTPYDRVINHMAKYTCSTIYAVNRAKYLKIILKNLSNEIFEDACLVELFIEMSNAYMGKSIIIPDIMWFRSIENDTLYDKSKSTYENTWVDCNKKENLIATFNLLFKKYHPNFETKKMVSIGLEKYFLLENTNAFAKRRYILRPSFSIKFIAFYKYKIKYIFKLNLFKIILNHSILKQKNLDHVLYTLKNDSVKYNYFEIKELEQFIHKFYLFNYGRI